MAKGAVHMEWTGAELASLMAKAGATSWLLVVGNPLQVAGG